MKQWIQLSMVVVAAVFLTGCNPLAKKAKSGLQVLTNDIPASLFLDGQYLDKTPYISKEIQPGPYTLRIQPDDPSRIPYETTITLAQGTLSVLAWKPGVRPELSGGVLYEMEKLKGSKRSEFSLISIPDGAIVSFDTQPKDFAPIALTDLEPGQHEFEVTLPSYESQKHTVNLVAGYRVVATVKMAKVFAQSENAPIDTATESASLTSPSQSALKTSPTPKPATSSALPTTPIVGASITITKTGFIQEGVEGVRVRQTGSSVGAIIGFAPSGGVYKYLETQGDWYKIEFSGQPGWVTKQYATLKQ